MIQKYCKENKENTAANFTAVFIFSNGFQKQNAGQQQQNTKKAGQTQPQAEEGRIGQSSQQNAQRAESCVGNA